MKKTILISFFFLVFLSVFAMEKKDTLKNKKFMLGISIAPNYSWRKYYLIEGMQYGDYVSTLGKEIEKPSFGYSILLSGKITINHFMINVGAGFSKYNFIGHEYWKIPYPQLRGNNDYQYKSVLINFPIGYNIIFGKNKSYYAGLNFDFAYILSLIQKNHSSGYDYNTGDLLGKATFTYDYTKKMKVFWGGFEIGKIINLSKWLDFNISINCKYSSKIDTNPVREEIVTIYTPSRNLMASSINITFYPKLKTE